MKILCICAFLVLFGCRGGEFILPSPTPTPSPVPNLTPAPVVVPTAAVPKVKTKPTPKPSSVNQKHTNSPVAKPKVKKNAKQKPATRPRVVGNKNAKAFSMGTFKWSPTNQGIWQSQLPKNQKQQATLDAEVKKYLSHKKCQRFGKSKLYAYKCPM